MTFTIVVTNDGTSTATPVTVTDSVPAGLDVQSARTGAGSCAVAGNEVTCADLSVAAGGGSIEVVITATATGNGVVANVAEVSCPCSTAVLSSAPAEVVIERTADLSVTTTASASEVSPGTPVTFTVTVRNAGPDDAIGVIVTDRLLGGLASVSSNATVGTYDPASGVWTVGALGSGSTAVLTVIATPAFGGMFRNVATVDSEVIDPSSANDRAAATVSSVAADLPRTGVADSDCCGGRRVP